VRRVCGLGAGQRHRHGDGRLHPDVLCGLARCGLELPAVLQWSRAGLCLWFRCGSGVLAVIGTVRRSVVHHQGHTPAGLCSSGQAWRCRACWHPVAQVRALAAAPWLWPHPTRVVSTSAQGEPSPPGAAHILCHGGQPWCSRGGRTRLSLNLSPNAPCRGCRPPPLRHPLSQPQPHLDGQHLALHADRHAPGHADGAAKPLCCREGRGVRGWVEVGVGGCVCKRDGAWEGRPMGGCESGCERGWGGERARACE